MRLLTDANTSQRFVEILRKLGWDIQTAYEAGLAGKNVDVPYIIHARKEQRIFLTFDNLRAEHGVQVAQELRHNGGKVIRVAGGPDQEDYRALGKLLFHYPEWHPFLDAQSGVAVISDLKSCKRFTPQEYHHHYYKIDAEQFETYLKSRSERPYRPRKRRRRPSPSEQIPMS